MFSNKGQSTAKEYRIKLVSGGYEGQWIVQRKTVFGWWWTLSRYSVWVYGSRDANERAKLDMQLMKDKQDEE